MNFGGLVSIMWWFPIIRGTLFCGPYNKDPTNYLGYYVRVPYFRKPPCRLTARPCTMSRWSSELINASNKHPANKHLSLKL